MQLFLNGEWTGLSGTVEVANPYDESLIDTVPSASSANIASAIDNLPRVPWSCAICRLINGWISPASNR